jgi:hypothetical protein
MLYVLLARFAFAVKPPFLIMARLHHRPQGNNPSITHDQHGYGQKEKMEKDNDKRQHNGAQAKVVI